METEKTHTYTGKKWNQKIATALAAAEEISVGAAAVTTAVLAKLDGSFTWNEAQKGTDGFFETKQCSGSLLVVSYPSALIVASCCC